MAAYLIRRDDLVGYLRGYLVVGRLFIPLGAHYPWFVSFQEWQQFMLEQLILVLLRGGFRESRAENL